MRNNIELLAPAGGMEALIAGIQNGANAVYLGGQNFSARASANNFSNEELLEAICYAHFRGVKIYVTVNTILSENELENAMDYINYLNTIGVDGVIVQDLGLVKAIRDNYPELDLHASTQMTINSLEGAKYLERLGFTRIVLARETPLSEVKLIKEHTDLQVEAFAHGALCVSYSGQCYMSSMIGGRSGNRGRCAQPCRKSYKVIKEDGQETNTDRAYLISPKDLYSLENLDLLIEAGIDSLKLEGRMKRPEYVATVVAAYRAEIDKHAGKNYKKKLMQAFNRGFTKGLPLGAFGRDFADPSRPDNRGLEVGRVLSSNRNKVQIEFFEPINQGDLLEFETGRNRKTYQVEDPINSTKVKLNLGFEVLQNSEVRRIINEAEFQLARESYLEDRVKRPIKLRFVGKLGELPCLTLETEDIKTQAFGDQVVEGAKKAPMDKEKITKQLEKLGDTNFSLGSIEIDIDDDIFLPVSVLNSMRRQVTEEAEKIFIDRNKRPSRKVSIGKKSTSIVEKDFKFAVSLENKEQFEKINISGISRFYLRFLDEKIYKDLISQGKEVYYRPRKVLFHKDYQEILENIKKLELTGVLVDNLGGLEAFKEYKKIGDTGLNVFNSHAIDLLVESDINDIILSPELTFGQIASIRSKTDKTIETTGYGFLRVMTMVHCPYSLIKNCGADRQCSTCNFRQGYSLRDEMNVDFRTKREDDFSIIYNSYPISIIEELDRVRQAGIDYLLLDFSFEEDPKMVIDEFIKAKSGQASNLNKKLKAKWKNITNGHYFRGIE